MRRTFAKEKNVLTSRRGISLVEVVISLAVIAIVSASALTLILSHTKLEAQTLQTKEAANIAENIIECFRYADDSQEFDKALTEVFKAQDYKAATEENRSFESFNFPLSYNGTTYNVELQVQDNEFSSGSKLEITVGTASNPEIISKEYTKYL